MQSRASLCLWSHSIEGPVTVFVSETSIGNRAWRLKHTQITTWRITPPPIVKLNDFIIWHIGDSLNHQLGKFMALMILVIDCVASVANFHG